MEESDLVIRAARIICSASKDMTPQIALYCAGAPIDESCEASLVEKVNEKLPLIRQEIDRIDLDSDNVKMRVKVSWLLSGNSVRFMSHISRRSVFIKDIDQRRDAYAR